MSNINEKYYIGFEGEPEIIFTIIQGSNPKMGVGLWSGYFDNIMRQINPKEGKWTALAYYYHLNIGWYDESPWLIENIADAYKQLKEIDIEKLEQEEKELIEIILNILKYAIDKKCQVFISYE